MPDYSLPLATSTWDDAEYSALERVIQSGQFTMGSEVAAFETAFSKYHKTRYAVMVNSGSSANLLMIAALFFRKNNALRPGDEVIVPAVSWSTTYAPLQQYGLKVKFVDIDLYSLNVDLDQLEQAITSKTRLILMVNLLGNPNDFRRLEKIIEGRDVLVVEDNCESLGRTRWTKNWNIWIDGYIQQFLFASHLDNGRWNGYYQRSGALSNYAQPPSTWLDARFTQAERRYTN